MKIQKSISLVKKFSAYLVSAILLQTSLVTVANAINLDAGYPSFLFQGKLMHKPGQPVNVPGALNLYHYINENYTFNPLQTEPVSYSVELYLLGISSESFHFFNPKVKKIAEEQGLQVANSSATVLADQGFQLARPIDAYHAISAEKLEQYLGKTQEIYTLQVGDLRLFGRTIAEIKAALQSRGLPIHREPNPGIFYKYLMPAESAQGVEVRGYICDQVAQYPKFAGQRLIARAQTVYRVNNKNAVPEGCEEYVRFPAWRMDAPLVYLASAPVDVPLYQTSDELGYSIIKVGVESAETTKARVGYDQIDLIRMPFYSQEVNMLHAAERGKLMVVAREVTHPLATTNLINQSAATTREHLLININEESIQIDLLAASSHSMAFERSLLFGRRSFHPSVVQLAEEILGVKGFHYGINFYHFQGNIIMQPNMYKARLLVDSVRYRLGQVSLAELRAAYEALR